MKGKRRGGKEKRGGQVIPKGGGLEVRKEKERRDKEERARKGRKKKGENDSVFHGIGH